MPSPRMSEEEIWSYVESAYTGIFTTLRRDGMPIALPIWYACIDRKIYMDTRRKKLTRVANDPRASFLVEDGARWSELKAVHMTGTIDVIDSEHPAAAEFAEQMDRKYASFRTAKVEMPLETAQHYDRLIRAVLQFTPTGRILNWDNSKLTA